MRINSILLTLFCLTAQPALAAETQPPNIVILFADDFGYGDLGCYGHPTIRTPHIDRMADEGMRFTQFYSAAPVCTPSRAALLTGRLPIRNGMCHDRRRVLFSNSTGGLPEDEVTLAEALKTKGYRTACIGKWHLGHLPPYWPLRHGFDHYFGLPYSNDMKPLSLFRGDTDLENPVDQTTLTRRYTAEAVRFIRDSHGKTHDRPFFLYLPYTMPHVPLFASSDFLGTSPRGIYGDVIEEIDWSVGQILETLRDLGLAENTFVFFTSDNGPWLIKHQNGGSAGLLRGGKGSTWEGGMREPGIAWQPGRIPAGVVTQELGTTMDLFATSLAMAGVELPSDRTLDGVDLSPVLFGDGPGPREQVVFYRGTQLMAIRKGPWKAHFQTRAGYRQAAADVHDPPLLFHLDHDPSEKYDMAEEYPEVVADLIRAAEEHRASVVPGPSQL